MKISSHLFLFSICNSSIFCKISFNWFQHFLQRISHFVEVNSLFGILDVLILVFNIFKYLIKTTEFLNFTNEVSNVSPSYRRIALILPTVILIKSFLFSKYDRLAE